MIYSENLKYELCSYKACLVVLLWCKCVYIHIHTPIYITNNAVVNVMVVIYWKLSDKNARQSILIACGVKIGLRGGL